MRKSELKEKPKLSQQRIPIDKNETGTNNSDDVTNRKAAKIQLKDEVKSLKNYG